MAYVPEFRAMISAGRQYLHGEIDFLELRDYAVGCAQAAKLFGAPAQVFQMAEDWNRMIESHWNEWGLISAEQLITEEELRAYIAVELDVFASHDHLPKVSAAQAPRE